MKHTGILALLAVGLLFAQCKNEETTSEVNVYTHRHYEVDEKVADAFTEATGIQVNMVSASADELMQRLEMEGEGSPADVLITVDAGRLERAVNRGLLQKVSSDRLERQVPEGLRHSEGYWWGLTYRARVIAYHPERVDTAHLKQYEDLADERWKNRILVRSSSSVYNQSLLASLLFANGEESAKNWAAAVVENMAREPKGGDRDQIKAVAAGEGDVAIVNTYYHGLMLNDSDPQVRAAGESVRLLFPNQAGRGAHINVSGAGVTQHAPNKENAIRFIEFMTDTLAQKQWAMRNYEYPVHREVELSETLQSWGEFKKDTVPLEFLGQNNERAVRIFDKVGWN